MKQNARFPIPFPKLNLPDRDAGQLHAFLRVNAEFFRNIADGIRKRRMGSRDAA